MKFPIKNETKESLEEKIDLHGLDHYFLNKVDVETIEDPRFKIAVLEFQMANEQLREFLDDYAIAY